MHVQLSSFVPISAGKAGFPSVAAAVAAAARLFGGAPRRPQLGWTPASEFPDMSLHYRRLIFITLLLFLVYFTLPYFFSKYENKSLDIVDILGTAANLMIAVAVFKLQVFSSEKDIDKKREKDTREVLLILSELFFEHIDYNCQGNKYDVSRGEEVRYPYTNKRYLVFWKFEYIATTDRLILELGCRRLYFKTGRHYYGSTMIVAFEAISNGNFVKSYRNDKHLDVLKEDGRRNVRFSNFTSKEWDTAMEIMPRKLFEIFGSSVPASVAL